MARKSIEEDKLQMFIDASKTLTKQLKKMTLIWIQTKGESLQCNDMVKSLYF